MNGAGAVEFRAAEPADALCIGALAVQVFLDTYATDGIRPDLAREALQQYGPEAFELRLRDPANHFVVAERAGHLLGFSECCVTSVPPLEMLAAGVELVRLYVQPNAQRCGIGHALMQRAEAFASAAGRDWLWLTAWVGNARARAFYAAEGYRDLGSTAYVFEGQAYENRILARPLHEPATRASSRGAAFATLQLPATPTTVAPDGSDVRVLLRLTAGSMAHFELAAGQVARAVAHRSVDEIWYVIAGRGEMWRKQGEREEIIALGPGVCLTIPRGTRFQFRAAATEAVSAVAVTLPPWPDDDDEAVTATGPWEPSSASS